MMKLILCSAMKGSLAIMELKIGLIVIVTMASVEINAKTVMKVLCVMMKIVGLFLETILVMEFYKMGI